MEAVMNVNTRNTHTAYMLVCVEIISTAVFLCAFTLVSIFDPVSWISYSQIWSIFDSCALYHSIQMCAAIVLVGLMLLCVLNSLSPSYAYIASVD